MKRILIITGGEVDYTSSLEYIIKRKYEKIIVVDGGLKYADDMKLNPDLIIGDFDTVDHVLLDKYSKKNIKVEKLDPRKDDTDTCEAFARAINHMPDVIDILGGTGSRFDHTYANMFLLKKACDLGIKAYIINKLNRISVIKGENVFLESEKYGKYISFIQFDGSARGVTLKGFEYPLDKFDFDTKKTYRLGVSNEYGREVCIADIEEGYLLTIESKDDREF